MPSEEEVGTVSQTEEAPSVEASGGETPSGDDGFEKYKEALTKAGLDNWVDTGSRIYSQRNEAREALKAIEAEKAELLEKLDTVQTQAESKAEVEALTKQAIKQGFRRSQVSDYLDDHTVEDLKAELEKDSERGEPEPAKRDSKLEARLKKMEQELARRDEDQSFKEQFHEAMTDLADGMTDVEKTRVTKEVAREIELARVRHQKMPNIKELVAREVSDIKALTAGAVEAYTKKNGKGSPATSLAEKPDSRFQRAVDELNDDEKEALRLIQADD